jgi:hypothetical protein
MADLQELQRLWIRALRCWSELWRCDEFWQEAVEDWRALKAKGDAKADLFNEAQWRGFRQRLPEHILLGHMEAARQAVLDDAPRARMYIHVVKNSGFDPADQDRVRGGLYAPFRPDEEEVARQQTFVEALDRVGQYLELDGDYPPAMRAAVAITGQWVHAAATGQIDLGRKEARLQKAIGKAKALAASAGLHTLAKDNSTASQEIAEFYLALAEYHIEKANKAWKDNDHAQTFRDLDEACQARQLAIPLERCTHLARSGFFALLSQAVKLRLDQGPDAASSELARAEELVGMGMSVEADEPHMLMQQARIEGAKGNASKFEDLLRQAKQQALGRDDPDLVAEIARAQSQGPNHAKAARLRRKGVEAMERQAFREGIRYLREALGLCPDDPLIEVYLGQAYLNSGQRDTGMDMLTTSKSHAQQQGLRQLEQQIDGVLKMERDRA